MPAAAMIAGTFCKLQKSSVNAAMYYDGMPSRPNYCGLFTYPEYGVAKPYYSFKMFNELYKLGNEIKSSSDFQGLHTCAATDGNNYAILISLYETFDLSKKSTLKFDPTGVIIGRNDTVIDKAKDKAKDIVKDETKDKVNDVKDQTEETNEKIQVTLEINHLDTAASYVAEYFLLDDKNNMTLIKKENINSHSVNLEMTFYSVMLIKIIHQ